jgi:hypothetical protein
MKFSTEVVVTDLANKISYDSKIVSLGSCFAVNMSENFKKFQFQHSVNPFGILFHSQALANLLEFAVTDKVFDESDIFYHNEIWSSFDAHSDMNELEDFEILLKLNQKIRTFKTDLQQASHLIITLGTAWVYKNIATNKLVANCHKILQKEFTKEILSVATIEQNLHDIVNYVTKLNPNIQCIFTLSPVRHLKDGLIENQRSKAHLITALQNFLEGEKQHYYFPSYEIIMDELRDYRYYGADLLHPNEIALQYIWEKFSKHCITESAYPTMQLVDEVQKGLAHRPFNPYSEQHAKFLDKLGIKLDTLLEKYPFMNFR